MIELERLAVMFLAAACGCAAPDGTSAPDEASTPPARNEALRPMLVVPLPAVAAAAVSSEAGGIPPDRIEHLVAREVPVHDFLLTLFRESDLNLLIEPGITGTVTCDIKAASPEEALEQILRSLDLAFEWDGSFLRVRSTLHASIDVDLLDGSSSGGGGGGGAAGSGGGGGGGGGGGPWSRLEQDITRLIGSDGLAIVNPVAGTIDVEARPSAVERVRDYVERCIDRATNQVSLEARILEVRLNDEFRLGVNWSLLPGFLHADETGLLANGALIGQTAASGGSALNVGVLRTDEFAVFVDALERQGQVRVLSSPRVSTLNNTPATIRVIDRLPVIEREVIDSQGGLRTQFDVRFVDAGVSVSVTPQIGVDGVVTASVAPIVTEQTGTVTTPDGLVTEPILSIRETMTSVRVPDGRAIVIGGLRSTRKSEEVTGVPVLSNIPLLGALFRGTVQSRDEVELMVVVVPRILDDRWIDEELRRGTDRLVELRQPFGLGSIGIEDFRPESWRYGFLQGELTVTEGTTARAESPAPDAAAPNAGEFVVTRSGLARRIAQRADDAFAAGLVGRSIELLARSIELEPRPDAMLRVAVLESQRGNVDRARRLAERAVALAPEDVLGLTVRGILQWRAGTTHRARRDLGDAHARASNPLTATNYGAALLASGDAQTARAVLQPHTGGAAPPELFANLAIAELTGGDVNSAHAALDRGLAIGLDPNDPRVRALSERIERDTRSAATVAAPLAEPPAKPGS